VSRRGRRTRIGGVGVGLSRASGERGPDAERDGTGNQPAVDVGSPRLSAMLATSAGVVGSTGGAMRLALLTHGLATSVLSPDHPRQPAGRLTHSLALASAEYLSVCQLWQSTALWNSKLRQIPVVSGAIL
jgi:hypothetical protein